MNQESIFNTARKIADAQAREEYLQLACRDDVEILQQIRKRLDDDVDSSFLDSFSGEVGETQSIPESMPNLGERIGCYKLLQVIGEGGMGSVYMADQTEPVKRRVALKIIKAGMDSKQVIARFEAERQALAMMDHPNIARLLDVGTTDQGRPFFVMELVKGSPITRFCDEKRLNVKQRLELFTSVCMAVQHAHQKGVIHRDLKPSNILVAEYDSKIVPKIIDFGLAKALHQNLTDATMFTQFGQVVGTLAYMSPEQSNMNQLDVDTRTDVYSLGVLLYELLTGTTPFDAKRLKSAAMDQVLKIIREEEPARPSTRLSTIESSVEIAERRGTEPRKLSGLLRGDLDWIVVKALAKEKSRRYETANGFALDVRRFLNTEPVIATPPSAGYKFRKFAQRNKTLLSAVAAIATILLAATVVSTSLAVWATRQKELAEVAAKEAEVSGGKFEAINDFLINDFLAAARPSGTGPGKDVTVKYALDRAIDKIDTAFEDQPEVEAAVRRTLGQTYLELSYHDDAERQLVEALRLHRQLFSEVHPETLESRSQLARLRHLQGDYPRAEQLYRELGNDCQQELGKIEERTIYAKRGLSIALSAQGKLEENEKVLREIVEICVTRYGPAAKVSLDTHNELAYLLHDQGKFREAERVYRRILDIELEELGERHITTLVGYNNLASVLEDQRRFDEAGPLYKKSLRIRREVFGDEHTRTTTAMNNLAVFLSRCGEYDEAGRILQDAINLGKQLDGPEHRYTLLKYCNLGTNLMRQGKLDEANKLFRETIEKQDRVFGPNHPDVLECRKRLADCLIRQDQLAEAETILRDVLSKRRDRKSIWQKIAATLTSLGSVLRKQQEFAESETLLRECVTLFRGHESVNVLHFAMALSEMGHCLLENKKLTESEKSLLEAQQLIADQPYIPARVSRESISRLVQLYLALDKPEIAESWSKKLE